jgi:glycosyltransferase involved in cell wall biosynthesis
MALLRKSVGHFLAASDPVARNLTLRQQIPGDRITTVHELISCTGVRKVTRAEQRRCRSWLGLDPQARIVLGCGTTDWRKGPDLFVEVAARTLQKYEGPIQFVWVGAQTAKEKSELGRQLAASNLNHAVQFVGAVASPLPYMLASDLFLLPSREDPFPLVCLEAADCGLPTVCFAKAGGMPEFVATDCGAVVPFLNVDRMARAVLSFLADDALRRACGQRARTKVREQFDVSIKGRKIYEVLEAICAQPAEQPTSRGTP